MCLSRKMYTDMAKCLHLSQLPVHISGVARPLVLYAGLINAMGNSNRNYVMNFKNLYRLLKLLLFGKCNKIKSGERIKHFFFNLR
jgi:hypothetical protein